MAWPLVGAEAQTIAARARSAFGEHELTLATWVAARSRITEDWLAKSGAEQYVIVGAGLDSFAWRQTSGLAVFEVDHPATQAWKRARLEALGSIAPAELVWLPVDFEVDAIGDALQRGDLGRGETFVSWLGVTPYLSLQAIEATLRGLPRCWLAVSHGTPQDTWPPVIRDVSDTFGAIAREGGEPPVSRFTPEQFAHLLAEHGFEVIEEVGFEVVQPRFGLPALSVGNERLVLARRP
jgi:methyltransferase (TIGR00027 family)